MASNPSEFKELGFDDDQAATLDKMARDLSVSGYAEGDTMKKLLPYAPTASDVLKELWDWVNADALGGLVPQELQDRIHEVLEESDVRIRTGG